MKIITAIQILIKLFTIGYGAGAVRTTGRFAAPAAAGKRADTCGFYPLNSRFPLFQNPAQTRDRRPLRKGERQRILSTVGAHNVRPFLYLYAVSDFVLLHRRVHLRRRDITVSRNTLACCNARHLRIKHSVQFIFAGAFRHNAQKNWAALSCRPLRGLNLMCSSTLSVNCEKVERATQR